MHNLYTAVPLNSAFIALASIWQALVMYIMVPYVIALAGEAHYGLWVLLSTLSVMGLFGFLDLGLIGSVVKWVADAAARDDHRSAEQVVNIALAIFAPLGAVLGAGMLLSRPLLVGSAFDIPPADRELASLMVMGLAVQVFADFVAMPLTATAQAFLRFGWLRSLQSIKATLFALLSVLALRAGHGIEVLPMVAAGLALLHLPALVWLTRRQLPGWRPRLGFERELVDRVVKFSARVFVLRITGALYRNMDKLIIGALIGTVAVKNYDIVYKVHAIALLPLSFVTPLIVPIASSMSATSDEAGLRALVLKGSKYMGALCIPIAAGVFVLAEPLLLHWLGPAEAQRAQLVQLFVSYLFFWPLIQIGWNSMIGQDRVGPLVAVAIVSVGANLALSLALIDSMGIAGVMVATIVTNFGAFLAHAWLQLRAVDAGLGQYLTGVLLPTLLPSALSAGVIHGLLLLRQPGSIFETLVFLGLGVLAALGLFWLIGIDAEERSRVTAGILPRAQ